MIHAKLTNCACRAHKAAPEGGLMKRMRAMAGVMVLAGTVPVAGCISIEAPDKPIVIELNINITQEVIYRLADDANNLIEENAEIF
jgi:hypothetical protein